MNVWVWTIDDVDGENWVESTYASRERAEQDMAEKLAANEKRVVRVDDLSADEDGRFAELRWIGGKDQPDGDIFESDAWTLQERPVVE